MNKKREGERDQTYTKRKKGKKSLTTPTLKSITREKKTSQKYKNKKKTCLHNNTTTTITTITVPSQPNWKNVEIFGWLAFFSMLKLLENKCVSKNLPEIDGNSKI